MKIVLATKNKGKLSELRKLLEGLDVELFSISDFPDMEMPPEEGETFVDNALSKARHVTRRTGLAALADDSGLVVDALGGRPGVYSARYAGADATDEQNYLKLLDEMKEVGRDKRTARFKCAIALTLPSGEEKVFEGELEGCITDEPRGEGGFGYDPVFYIPALKKNAAELTRDEKNAISHRGKALQKVKRFLSESKK